MRRRRPVPLLRPLFSLSLVAVMCVSVSAQVVEKKKDSVRFIKPLPLEKAGEVAPRAKAPDARPVGNVEALPLTDADKLHLNLAAHALNLQTDYRGDAAPTGFALPHTGELAWMRKVANDNPRSPAASGDFVVVGSGHGNAVYGIDITTGERKWMYQSKDAGISNIEIDGDSAYYTTYSCTLERVQVLTGKNVYSRWISSTVDNQPVVAEGRVYCSFQGNGGTRLTSHSAESGAESWSILAGSNGGIQGPVFADGCVFLATMDGSLGCYNPATGATQWKAALGLTAAPVAVPGGILCVMPAAQELSAPEEAPKAPAPEEAKPAKPENDKDSVVPVKPKSEAPPTPQQGTLVTHGNVRLGMMSAKAAPKASVPVTGPVARGGLDYQGARPGFDGEMAFFAAGGRITAMELTASGPQWEVVLADGTCALTTPVVSDGLVITATNGGYVLALSRRTGRLVWCYKFAGQSFLAKPAVGKGRVLLTSANGTLISLPTGLSGSSTVEAARSEAEVASDFAKKRAPEAPKAPSDPNTGTPDAKPGDRVEGPQPANPPAAPQPGLDKGQFERAEKRKQEREEQKGRPYEPKPFRRP